MLEMLLVRMVQMEKTDRIGKMELVAVRTSSQFAVTSTTHIINASISDMISFVDFKDAILSMSLAKDGRLFIKYGYKYNGWTFNIILKYVK